MNATLAARLIVTFISAGQGIAPLLIDLNCTHAVNRLWPGHARFHVVWQATTALPLAAVAIAVLWWPGAAFRPRFYLAALLTAAPMIGFLAATASRALYGGTLHDPNGIQPARVRVASRDIAVDMNLTIVGLASVLLIASVLLFGLA